MFHPIKCTLVNLRVRLVCKRLGIRFEFGVDLKENEDKENK